MTYDLKPIDLPRLTGLPFFAFVKLLENPLVAKILIPKLFRDARIEEFQKKAVDEPPLFQPRIEPGTYPAKSEVDRSLRMLLDGESAHTSPSGFSFATIRDFSGAYRRRVVSPVEVARQTLESIRKSDSSPPPLRALVAWDEEDLIRQARASAKRYARGKPLSIFDGVPVAVKDEMDQIPYRTTLGTSFYGSGPATEDATAVSRLRASGALLFGKTNMHEIGMGVTGLNLFYGTPRNPYNPQHYTGGSSSGSAAAVAAGLCPCAIGADGGGSIRIPASFCGVVGLKPTWSRVSEFGAAPLCWSVAHIGPLAGTVRDVALTYALMAGPDPRDCWTEGQPAVDLIGFENTDLKDVRLGIYEPWLRDADSEVVAKCEQAVRELTKKGARTKEIVLPELDSARVAHAATISSEMGAAMAPYFDEHLQDFGLDVRNNLALTRHLASTDYIKAQRIRARTMAHFRRAFQQVDAIVTPATACTAPPILPDALSRGESNIGLLTRIMKYATVANLIGIPAISQPVGYDRRGLPVGIQLMGDHWQESLLLRIAHVLEKTVEKKAPSLNYAMPLR